MKKVWIIFLILSSLFIGGCLNNNSSDNSQKDMSLDSLELKEMDNKSVAKRFTSFNSEIYALGTTEWLYPSSDPQPFEMVDNGTLWVAMLSNKPAYISFASIAGYPINTTLDSEKYYSDSGLYLNRYKISIAEMKSNLTPIINHELKIKYSTGQGYEDQTHSVRVTLGY